VFTKEARESGTKRERGQAGKLPGVFIKKKNPADTHGRGKRKRLDAKRGAKKGETLGKLNSQDLKGSERTGMLKRIRRTRLKTEITLRKRSGGREINAL